MNGTFNGKIVEYGIGKTSAGLPQVVVKFNVEDKSLTWYGSLKEGRAKEITLKAVTDMGYREKNFDLLSDGKGLDTATEYSLVIDEELGNDGKVHDKIKWVNTLGGSGIKKVSKEEAKSLLAGLNIEAALAPLVTKVKKSDSPF